MQLGFSRKIFPKTLKYQKALKNFEWDPSCSMRTDGPTQT